MHLDSIGESRGFDGWEIKIRDIADLRQFAPVHGRDRLTDCRRSEAAIIGKTIISRRRKNARTATLRCRRLLISAAFTRDDTQEIGRAHVRTPVTTAHLVCRLLLE